MYLAPANLHRFDPKRWTYADLVIEIVSPNDRARDHVEKRAEYAQAGVPEYWIVDPDAETVSVLTLTEGRYEPMPLGEAGVIDSAVVPGLALTLERVFADLT